MRSTHEHWDGTGYPDGLAGRGDPARGSDRRRLATPTRRCEKRAPTARRRRSRGTTRAPTLRRAPVRPAGRGCARRRDRAAPDRRGLAPGQPGARAAGQAVTGCSSSAFHSPATASEFIRARWANACCAASTLAGSPTPRLERRRLQRTAVGERERPRAADAVDLVQVPRRLDLGLAAGEEDDPGHRRRNVPLERLDRQLGDPARVRLRRTALARRSPCSASAACPSGRRADRPARRRRRAASARSRRSTSRSSCRRPSAPRARRSARCPAPGRSPA